MNYVPYDVSKWSDFSSFILGNMGSAGKAGILILMVICGISLLVAIVKKFIG